MLLHGADVSSRLIEDGDLVVVYERFDSMKAVKVTEKGTYGNKFGNFALKDWIGKPFGSKMHARPPSKGWVYVLAPTPELWTQVLRHRTQILYVADISMVCTMLELSPGCTVLESGTGSGSLTTSLARAVAPTGHVHTFEFHQQRATTAAEEFQQNGLGEVITVTQRDIEGEGFPAELHGTADALFLDLPGPWKVVPSAAECLRPDGVFCSFSPCIEQVQRTCEALNAHGFREMRTMEVLLRQYEVTSERLVTDLGVAPPQPRGGSPPQQQQQEREQEVGEARGGQPAKRARTDQSPNAPTAAEAVDGTSRGEEQGAAGDGAVQAEEGEEREPAGVPHPAAGSGPSPAERAGGHEVDGDGAGANGAVKGREVGKGGISTDRRVLARPVAQGRGHTGYLTFARRAVS